MAISAGGAFWLFQSGGDASAALTAEFGEAYARTADFTGRTVEIDLVAAPTEIDIVPNGPTDAWAFNGTVPGPELRVGVGDTVRVNLRNELPEPTTVHWHGVRVPNAMDGVPAITQNAVAPGDSFVYEFSPPNAGTFWYHSHTNGSEQVERGLYGALIVEEPEDLGYSRDVVWLIDDWELTDDGLVDPAFVTSNDVEHNGRWGTTFTVNGSTSEILVVRPGERVRLRMINASNARVYAPRFGDLDATAVAVDALAVGEPFAADGFELSPGNRIDVDLAIPEDANETAAQVIDNITGELVPLGIIVVKGDAVTPPDVAPLERVLVPEWKAAATTEADHEIRFTLGSDGGQRQWLLNEQAFPNIDPVELDQGEFVKIRLLNDSEMLHPMHLHGQYFKVISRNGEPVDEGYFRDTILLKEREVIEIGLVPLDAGAWAFHCHIQEHADAGMLTVFNVA